MNKKTTKIMVILTGLIILSITAVAADTETITYIDEKQDVLDNELEPANKPNIDILQISAIKNGKEVELKLKLNEGGLIQKSTFVHFYVYALDLVTSKDEYAAMYTGLNLSSLTPEQLEELGGQDISLWIMDGQGNNIDVISIAGEGENELSIKFNINNINEKLIALSANVYETVANQTFSDFYEITPLDPIIKSNYDIKTGTPLNFEATLENGTASDYNWLWVFDDSSITLEGQNPSYTFNTPQAYTGTLYVYDGKSSMGFDTFQVNVTGNSTNGGNNNNNQPGFELMLIIAAIAITLLIFRKKKK
ncbi:MAG: PKD domain-containing protein [Candidatus Thermoplasmatota archaeon]|nr:PKD domain-containing protein [Candidatus Thermoplasmatota archaeon]